MFVISFFMSEAVGADFTLSAMAVFTAVPNNLVLAMAVVLARFGHRRTRCALFRDPGIEGPVRSVFVNVARFAPRCVFANPPAEVAPPAAQPSKA